MTNHSIEISLSLALAKYEYLLFEEQTIFRTSNTQKYLNSWQKKNKNFRMVQYKKFGCSSLFFKFKF